MGKKKAASNKAASKAAKKVKAAQKVEKKEKKKGGKDEHDENEDLESILDKMRREWEDAHKVTEEFAEGPPSRRANATITPCPTGNYLWMIGGEFFNEEQKAYFYSDVFRYSPEKDEWRKFTSPTRPGPRSAHATVSMPSAGGKLFLFGGEFSSVSQTSFHHYRDFWCFDVQSHSWERIETKVMPTARSGHRMAVWKHYIFLFGGFFDPGIITRYLNDLWVFDTQDYIWREIQFREGENRPSPRSGFSFLPTAEGLILQGGYCKEYVKGKRPVGIMLDDTWFLKIIPIDPNASNGSKEMVPSAKSKPGTKAKAPEPFTVKWEKRKRPTTAFAPSIRSGCTMALWAAKDTGVLFGGVTDEDTSEETLESVFHNDLYGYQLSGKGRWFSLGLKKPKKAGGVKAKKKKIAQTAQVGKEHVKSRSDESEASDEDNYEDQPRTSTKLQLKAPSNADQLDTDDPDLTAPLPRYNAMLAVLRNTLYIYGGIFERGPREYTLDDFYSLQLDKLEKYTCLKESGVIIPRDGEIESSSSEDEDSGEDDEDSDEDEEQQFDVENGIHLSNESDKQDHQTKSTAISSEPRQGEVSEDETETGVEDEELRAQATAFMGVAKDATRSVEEVLSTPLPGETLAMFFQRSREYWTGKATYTSDNRGKTLRRDAFELAKERYNQYEPVLKEVERILAEAGLDENEMRQSVGTGPSAAVQSGSRNRR